MLALAVCELGCRLFLHPADYLAQSPVPDKILGAVLPARQSGYDGWGFRNRKVPDSVDIVAVGDSHTFGNCAKMDESWPYVLGRLTGQSVYTLALGGYGPNQYYHLLKTKALSLKPRTIICGLYMGDDFENAYFVTYGLDHWAYLRELPVPKNVDFVTWDRPPDRRWHKRLRPWLSHHSVVYRLVFREAFPANPSPFYDATELVVPEKNIRETFVPRGLLRRLDQQNVSVQEGMRISLKLFDEMNRLCRTNNIGFQIAIIPTKEMVFADYLERNKTLPLASTEVIDKVLANERLARDKLFQFFDASEIRYVDTLPALKRSREEGIYVRSEHDMHPNHKGYKVIADAIAQSLEKQALKAVRTNP